MGEYRIVYEANREKKVLTVRLVGHRREIYDQPAWAPVSSSSSTRRADPPKADWSPLSALALAQTVQAG